MAAGLFADALVDGELDDLRVSVVAVAGVVLAVVPDLGGSGVVGFAVAVELPVAVGLVLVLVPVLVLGVALAEVEEGAADGDGSVLGVADLELVGLAVLVGGSLVDGALVDAFVLADGLVELLTDVDVDGDGDGFGVGLEVVGVGAGVVVVVVGVALGDGVAIVNGSHC